MSKKITTSDGVFKIISYDNEVKYLLYPENKKWIKLSSERSGGDDNFWFNYLFNSSTEFIILQRIAMMNIKFKKPNPQPAVPRPSLHYTLQCIRVRSKKSPILQLV